MEVTVEVRFQQLVDSFFFLIRQTTFLHVFAEVGNKARESGWGCDSFFWVISDIISESTVGLMMMFLGGCK